MLFAQPAKQSSASLDGSLSGGTVLLTLLDEFEAIRDIALVGNKEQSAVMSRLPLRRFVFRNFGTKGNTATDNTAGLSRDVFGFEISPRVCLPDMRGEWAPGLAV